MKQLFVIFALLGCPFFASASGIITKSEIFSTEPPESSTWTIEKNLENNGIEYSIRFDFTKKGNGTISTVENSWVAIYDSHQDLETFKGGLLRQDFHDIDQDGYNDLILAGIKQIWHEEENLVIDEAPVTVVLLFEPKLKGFRLSYTSENYD
ncbi:MAG: hypothetical protein AAGJ81_14520 [Verrucomicrobiota bacterium]